MNRALALLLTALLAAGACGGGGDDDDIAVTPDAAADTPDAPTPPPTWTNFAQSFFEVYCHACHGPGDALRDYSLLAEVQAEATAIRAGVDSGQFPIGTGPKPSRDERDRLILWIDGGLPE
jgi:hypothetical protein